MKDWREDKAQMLARLKRIEGQVRGVAAMIEKEDECERVVQQFTAVRKAMDRAFFDLMSCVTRRELAELGIKDRRAEERLEKVTSLLARYG